MYQDDWIGKSLEKGKMRWCTLYPLFNRIRSGVIRATQVKILQHMEDWICHLQRSATAFMRTRINGFQMGVELGDRHTLTLDIHNPSSLLEVRGVVTAAH